MRHLHILNKTYLSYETTVRSNYNDLALHNHHSYIIIEKVIYEPLKR